MGSKGHVKEYYVFSPFLRIFHWVMVISVIVLFITGLLITKPLAGGNPGIEPTFADWRLSVDLIRNIHFIAAFVFTASFILRIYGFFVNKGDRLLPRFWEKSYWVWMVDVTKHYMLIQSTHKPYLRNPLARMSYAGLYVLVAVEIVTGFAMYLMVNPNTWFAGAFNVANSLLGSEFLTHLVHHYVAWLIIIFAIMHVYMAVRADFMEREGEISSMFSGVKFLAHEPLDGGEIGAAPKEETVSRQKQAGGATTHV